ncbi:MAG: hypothetical protein U0795_06515 [Pirellulales bacterium]
MMTFDFRKALDSLQTIYRGRGQTFLVLRMEHQRLRYLVVRPTAESPRLLGMGTITISDDVPWQQQLAEELRAKQLKCSQAVAMLTRSQFELVTVKLPPAGLDELPDLVQNLVASSVEDHSDELEMDYLITQEHDDGGRDAIVVATPRSRIVQLAQNLKEIGLTLRAVTTGGMGVVQLARHRQNEPLEMSVVVAVQEHEVDLAVLEGTRPLLFRTLARPIDETSHPADLLATEIDRTLTLLSRQNEIDRVWLAWGGENSDESAERLATRLALPVTLIDPFAGWQIETGETSMAEMTAFRELVGDFAAMIGAAYASLDERFELDLLHPRRRPSPPHPGRKAAIWSTAGIIVLSLLANEAYQRHRERRDELAELKQQHDQLAKEVGKLTELQQVTRAVASWRRPEVNWLDEMLHLSQTLPGSDQTAIQNLTMGALPNGNGFMTMGVQVSAPEVRSQLETKLRDDQHGVTSHRVSESGADQRLRWQFELQVELAGQPHRHGAPPESTASSDASPASPQPKASQGARQ